MLGYSIWVFIPTGQYSVPLFQWDGELPIFYPVARVIAFKLHGEGIRSLRPCLSPYRDERQMNHSYMVLLDMWNMFGQKFLSFIGGWSVGRVQQGHLLIINQWERRYPFQCGEDYYIYKTICQGTLYEFSFLQGSILCPYSNGIENSRFRML